MIASQPDSTGHFGPYGGRFVPEVLMAPLEEIEKALQLALEARDPRDVRSDSSAMVVLRDRLDKIAATCVGGGS